MNDDDCCAQPSPCAPRGLTDEQVRIEHVFICVLTKEHAGKHRCICGREFVDRENGH